MIHLISFAVYYWYKETHLISHITQASSNPVEVTYY